MTGEERDLVAARNERGAISLRPRWMRRVLKQRVPAKLEQTPHYRTQGVHPAEA